MVSTSSTIAPGAPDEDGYAIRPFRVDFPDDSPDRLAPPHRR